MRYSISANSTRAATKQLARNEQLDADGRLPAVLPLVIGLEQSRSLSDVARVAELLAAWLPDPQVRRAFADWMRQIVERLVPSGVEPPPIRKLEDVSMTLVERAAEWSKEWLKEGLEQGLEHERTLLCRMAASRYGAGTAERLAEVLAGVVDAERLTEVGDWLVQCDTGAEFLARLPHAPDGEGLDGA